MTGASPTQPKIPLATCDDDVRHAITVLEGRWKMQIVSHLHRGSLLRFSELRRAIPDASQKMLVQQLRALEADGVVNRTIHPQVPPKVEYELTELGRALGPIFQALSEWARLRQHMTDAGDSARTVVATDM